MLRVLARRDAALLPGQLAYRTLSLQSVSAVTLWSKSVSGSGGAAGPGVMGPKPHLKATDQALSLPIKGAQHHPPPRNPISAFKASCESAHTS